MRFGRTPVPSHFIGWIGIEGELQRRSVRLGGFSHQPVVDLAVRPKYVVPPLLSLAGKSIEGSRLDPTGHDNLFAFFHAAGGSQARGQKYYRANEKLFHRQSSRMD